MSNRALDLTVEPVLNLPRRFGRYRLTKLLAQGGMAQIYLAKAFGAEGFVKPLVIKRLTPSLTANQYFSSLFVNEAKLLVTLTHGNIVPVFDFGRVGDDLYMAMEYVHGASLRQIQTALTQMGERLDPELTAYIGAEVCRGLGYAHRRTDPKGQPAGIVHRDIKPTNVLISLDGEVKIVDFGVAKLTGRVEGHGQLTGTIAYMSPEQAERRVVDHRTDIFSTALLLYELLVFRRAYDVETPKEALVLARRAAIPPTPPGVPQELREIIHRATRREPDERFGSAQEMEMALSDYLLRARSGRTGDAEAPSTRLSALMKRLPIDRPEIDLNADDMDPTHQESDHDEVSGLLEPGDAPDLNLIHNAAETFHSEFLTRVLRDEVLGVAGRPLTRRLLLIAIPLLLIALALGLVWYRRSHKTQDPVGTGTTTGSAPARAPDARAPATSARADARRGNGGAPASRPDSGTAPAPDARPTKTSRPPRFGYLNLNSIPWSEVSIDGRPVRRPTPLLKLKLRVGAHTVVLVNREKKLKKTLQVVIRPGATTWKVVRLK